jgi:hypothetical protein
LPSLNDSELKQYLVNEKLKNETADVYMIEASEVIDDSGDDYDFMDDDDDEDDEFYECKDNPASIRIS